MLADVAYLLVVVTAVGGVAAAGWLATRAVNGAANRRHMRASADESARALAEQWSLWFLERYPRGSDAAIATLMHDELVNRRIDSPAHRRWMTAETVGRVRRTIIRSHVEPRA